MWKSLRIVVSVLCLTACVLVIVLWIRSQYTEDRVSGNFSSVGGFRFYSSRGCLVWCLNSAAGAAQGYPWGVEIGADFWLDPDDDRIVTVPTFDSYAGFSFLSLPYWFLLIAATISAGFTISKFRFSLRTLLIAMTLIAVLLGMIAILA